jgi:tRNA-binding protein
MTVDPEFKPAPIKPPISFADLDRIDVRVGTIVLVEEVASSDRLLKLTVDFGDHQRTILAGMKQERENPREIEGRPALFVVNLEPKKMMGQLSEGMLFDIGYADGVEPEVAADLAAQADAFGRPACIYPTSTLDVADCIDAGQCENALTKANGVPDLGKYFYDPSAGMLFFYVAQEFPNALGPAPRGPGAAARDPQPRR